MSALFVVAMLGTAHRLLLGQITRCAQHDYHSVVFQLDGPLKVVLVSESLDPKFLSQQLQAQQSKTVGNITHPALPPSSFWMMVSAIWTLCNCQLGLIGVSIMSSALGQRKGSCASFTELRGDEGTDRRQGGLVGKLCGGASRKGGLLFRSSRYRVTFAVLKSVEIRDKKASFDY